MLCAELEGIVKVSILVARFSLYFEGSWWLHCDGNTGWMTLLLRLCGVETWSLQLALMMSLIALPPSLILTLVFYFQTDGRGRRKWWDSCLEC